VRHALATACVVILLIALQNFGFYLFFVDLSPWAAAVIALGFGVGLVLLTTRAGVLATIVFIFILRSLPLFTLALDSWTTPYSLIWPAILLAIAAYGFWMSLAGQPIFKDLLAEPQAA
jgi:hypothetical protein